MESSLFYPYFRIYGIYIILVNNKGVCGSKLIIRTYRKEPIMTGLIINTVKNLIEVENQIAEILGEEIIEDKYLEWVSEDIQKHEKLFESLSALDVITLASMTPRIDKALPMILGSYPEDIKSSISNILIKAVHAALNF